MNETLRPVPQHDEQVDFSMATYRLLGIGFRPYDKKTLDGVRSRLEEEYGQVTGRRVFEDLQFKAILGINISSIRENYPEVHGEWFDDLEKQSIKV